jgi:hypothetical protein
MFHSAVIDAVRDRLLADNGTGGIGGTGTPLPGGVFSIARLAGATVRPFAVLGLSSQFDGSLARGGWNLTVTVTVYAEHQSQLDTAWTAIDRIVGNAYAASDSVPTYGIHGWTPSALTVSGYTVTLSGPIQHVSTDTALGDDNIATVTAVFQTRVNVSPA